MKTHPDRATLVGSLPAGLRWAELGVFEGRFSETIRERAEPSRLYLVDHFRGCRTSGDGNGKNVRTTDLRQVYLQLQAKYEGTEVEVVRTGSVQFLRSRAPDRLDAIYTDTLHTHKQVLAEFEAAREIGVRCLLTHDDNMPGVQSAVAEFCRRHGQRIAALSDEIRPTCLIVCEKPE